jgi:hypothetical protein
MTTNGRKKDPRLAPTNQRGVLYINQWERLLRVSRVHSDLTMRPSEMLRRCLEHGLRAAERGELHEVLEVGPTIEELTND